MNLRNITLHTWRRFTQIFFGLIMSNSYIAVLWTKNLYNGPLRSLCVPGLNCHSCPTAIMGCPIGMLQHYIGLHMVPYFVLGFLGIVGIIFGRAVCGWFCPFGLLQDWMYKIKSIKFKIPEIFSKLRYVFLGVFVMLLPYLTDTHWFSRLCPWGALDAAIPWVLWNPINPLTDMPPVAPDDVGEWFALKMVILAIFLVLFVFTARPFCKTMCPLGLIYGFFNKFSLLKIDVNSQCNECNLCSRKCILDLRAYESANEPECIKCLECATACNNASIKFNFDNVKLPYPTTPKNKKTE